MGPHVKTTVDRGDLIWIDFDPQAGSEQAGRRPALVISPRVYNSKSRVIIVCPITTKVKGFPFEVMLPAGAAVKGAVLADHIKSMDHAARDLELIGRAPQSVVDEVLARVAPLVS